MIYLRVSGLLVLVTYLAAVGAQQATLPRLAPALANDGASWHVTQRVSVADNGSQGEDDSGGPLAISHDGVLIAFWSDAGLVPGNSAGIRDVFVRNTQTDRTELISLASDGSHGNYHSWGPAMSADGRYVAFQSEAWNLVSNDTNSEYDIFVRDRETNTTTRVSITNSGTQSNGHSWAPDISDDGRFVAFESTSSNLVMTDTTYCPGLPEAGNSCRDIFVHDRATGSTERVSIASDGTPGNNESSSPSISADGRFVAFESYAENLVSGDTNGVADVFVHDRATGETERVSVASDGTQGNESSGGYQYTSISNDGRFVAFGSVADNLVAGDTNASGDIFVRDRFMTATIRISVASNGDQANSYSYWPAITGDGRSVTYGSQASNLAAGDTNEEGDTFVYDREKGTTSRISLRSDGLQGNDGSNSNHRSAISDDGRVVAFESLASNLTTGDTNSCHFGQEEWNCQDVFVSSREDTPSSRELRLVQKFSPIFWLMSGDYQPEEVQIMLDEPSRPNRTTALWRRIDRILQPDVSEQIQPYPSVSSLGAYSDANNYIDVNGVQPGNDSGYASRYTALAASYNAVTYADVVLDGSQIAIDYWLFYYYNDYGPLDHEGDWERVRVRTGATSIDEALSRNQGASVGVSRHTCDRPDNMPEKDWSEILTQGSTHPAIYVARGSHANYFGVGTQAPSPSEPCTLSDITAANVSVQPSVVLIDCRDVEPGLAWLAFRGRWGEWSGGARGPCRTQRIQANQTTSQLESIAPGQQRATFAATWNSSGVAGSGATSGGSDVVLALTSPSGRAINRDTVSGDVQHELMPSAERFTITNPESGDWTVNLFGATVPSEGELVEVAVSTTSQPEPTEEPTATPTSTRNPAPTSTPTNTPVAGEMFGDADCNGSVNAIDAALVLQYTAALISSTLCFQNADANGDGQTNVVDAALILQLVAGLLSSLPPQ